jgi:hypothetical protein
MKAITQAKATAHTARGWEKNEADSTGVSGDGWTGVDTDFLPGGVVTPHYIGNLLMSS